MYCIYCGAANPDTYNFCFRCGKPRSGATASSQPEFTTTDPFSRILKEAISETLDEDKNELESLITKAIKRPDKSIEEVIAELKYAAETMVDEQMEQQAKAVLEILVSNDGNSVAYLFRHGSLAPYEAAFDSYDFLVRSRWLRDGKCNYSVLRDDYQLYLRNGIEALLGRCTGLDQDAQRRLLESSGMLRKLEKDLVKEMILFLSLERKSLFRSDARRLTAHLGQEETDRVFGEVQSILDVVRWD